MEDSFQQWRNSSFVDGKNSFEISDSDDNCIENDSAGKEIFIVESSDSSVIESANMSLEKCPSFQELPLSEKAIKQKIKEHLHQYSDDEVMSDDKENYASSSDSDEKSIGDVTLSRHGKIKRKQRNKKFLETSSSSMSEIESSENNLAPGDSSNEKGIQDVQSISSSSINDVQSNTEDDLALSFAKQEVGVGNIDAVVAQKRGLLVCKMEQLQNQLSKTKLLLVAGNIDLLPDRGERLRESIAEQEKQIEEIATELENTPLTERATQDHSGLNMQETNSPIAENAILHENSYSYKIDPHYDGTNINSISDEKQLGKKAQATRERELALTVDRIQDLHGSLVARPSEDERAEDPRGLKVKLMPHQQHALAWLLWREQQRPPGGVLADDMGLGKTLTMISLIIADNEKNRTKQSDDFSDDEWLDYNKPVKHKGGTLVVCPASLLSQWEKEISNRCTRNLLSVSIHHGSNRETVPKRLVRNDVVITTYNILSREFSTMSTLYKIYWERIILDEAHVIRNHKSKASEAACGLLAKKRWALTGTPIQNKELDLYSVLKFLKCSPFDDLRVWKRWVDNKNAAGRQRLVTVMKTLMLRRTKQELQTKGELESLPDKCTEEVPVVLDTEEKLVYEKVLIYSRTLFAQFLAQRAEKDHMADLASGMYDRPSFLSNPNKNTQFTKAQNKLLSSHADVKTHEILVLLLRLRQICVHPSLIHSMLDQDDMKESGIMDMENVHPNLLSQMTNITLDDINDNEEGSNATGIGVDHRVATNLLTSQNPVFNPERMSSKMKAILRMVEEILQKNDKIVIVSQWATVLNVLASYLPSLKGATFAMFTGSVPIKERQGIMDSFNNLNGDPRILLLSLTAGGVGLNLVGGNHLLLIDIHWNPQLEMQAQDRIYRFGQKKDVFIYKFICKDTIEESIKRLQEKKLDIADSVLSGDKTSAMSKLTLNDLKSLFAL